MVTGERSSIIPYMLLVRVRSLLVTWSWSFILSVAGMEGELFTLSPTMLFHDVQKCKNVSLLKVKS